jgi:hypothetical protein
MKIRNIFTTNRRKKININPIVLAVIAFAVAIVAFNMYTYNTLRPKELYYMDTLDASFPIIYQTRNNKKINEMRGFVDERYSLVSNDTITMLEAERKLDLLIVNNKNSFNMLEYEIRDKTSNSLLERTKVEIGEENRDKSNDETRIVLNIQNLIKQNTSYLLTIKINVNRKTAYYFANIIYRPKNKLDEAIEQTEWFTDLTFNPVTAGSYDKGIVKYLETSINRDTKEMHTVTLQQTFEQLTFADTKMKLMSDYYFSIYQAQEYSYTIAVKYLTKSGKENKGEYFINRDEYVLRWDGKRWYYMKFTRKTEELINLEDNPFNETNGRFYTGVTNPDNITKLESENKRFFVFCKEREIYRYDSETKTMTNIYSYHIQNKKKFAEVSNDFAVKIMGINDQGDVTYIVYGYNMTGLNEGNMGIGVFTYHAETNESEENIFIPIYTSYQSLKYDIERLCVYKNNRLIFKSYNKVYSIDISTAEILTLADGFEETKFAASSNSRYFAFNNDKEGISKHINIYNIEDGKVTTIDAKEGENIEVVTFMNDDLFYGVFSDENIWKENGKIIGRPSHEIRVINAVDGKEDLFKEKDRYLYNFVNQQNVLRYNKYKREGTHYTYLTNDVIVNNYSSENTDVFNYKEELTKEKLRIGYFEIPMEKREKIKYEKSAGVSRKQVEETALESSNENEETIYYVYDSGNLKAKLKNLSDGVNEIRDNYGYVKLNDRITCYNRANKGNVSYLRQNDSIMENLEGFEENIYIKNNEILVMNVTGITERDLEYYLSLNEKIAVFKHDTFQFFITGYDNNIYILEYANKDRIMTPRDEVHEAVVFGGYVLFAQLESLE